MNIPEQKTGQAFVYGDNINTDVLAPGAYLKLSVEEMAQHCLESIDPDFVSNVKPGDVVVGGENFGVGSSREQAALSLVMLGVSYVLAKNFARIFYRNSFNLGLIALVCAETDKIVHGNVLSINPQEGIVENLSKNETYKTSLVPIHLMKIIESGGVLPDLKRRLEASTIINARYRKTL